MMTSVAKDTYRYDGPERLDLNLMPGHFYRLNEEEGEWEEIFDLPLTKIEKCAKVLEELEKGE
jgi:hypothetical protein